MALATSLAPMPQAMKKPKRQASISRIVPYSAIRVMVTVLCLGAFQSGYSWPLAGHKLFQAVSYALGTVCHVTDPFNDLIQKHDVDRW